MEKGFHTSLQPQALNIGYMHVIFGVAVAVWANCHAMLEYQVHNEFTRTYTKPEQNARHR